jgi:hypothetical protein
MEENITLPLHALLAFIKEAVELRLRELRKEPDALIQTTLTLEELTDLVRKIVDEQIKMHPPQTETQANDPTLFDLIQHYSLSERLKKALLGYASACGRHPTRVHMREVIRLDFLNLRNAGTGAWREFEELRDDLNAKIKG